MFLSVKETAAATNLSAKFIYEQCKAGRLPHIKTGRKLLLDPEQVAAFLHKEAAAAICSSEV